MYPVLFNINGFSLTTITVFLYLAFFAGLFVVWRLAKVYELDPEKTLDLFLMTSVVGLIFARINYILIHLQQLGGFSQAINIFKYPGYSFWGGFIAGMVFLWLYAHRSKPRFFFVADIAIVGAFLGIALTSLGCLFSVCEYGNPSSLPFAVTQVGLIAKRFPLQIVESLLFLFSFFYLWKKAVRYHFAGAIVTQGLILLGLFKFCLEFFRGDALMIPYVPIGVGAIIGFMLFIFGWYYYYQVSKRSFKHDLSFLGGLITNNGKRRLFFGRIERSWYNFMVNTKVTLQRKRKKLIRSMNVKSNPTQF